MQDEQQTRLRADARRNRDRILSTANTLFATQGPDVVTEDIARSAGVAPGTLYRHFADREALIRAVATNNLDHAIYEARAAEAEEPSAWDALVRILHQSHALRLSIRLLMAHPDVLLIMKKERRSDELRRTMLEILNGVVADAQAEGSLRADIGSGDLAVMFALLAHPLPIIGADLAELATERCMTLMLQSLRPHSGVELPGNPIHPSDLSS